MDKHWMTYDELVEEAKSPTAKGSFEPETSHHETLVFEGKDSPNLLIPAGSLIVGASMSTQADGHALLEVEYHAPLTTIVNELKLAEMADVVGAGVPLSPLLKKNLGHYLTDPGHYNEGEPMQKSLPITGPNSKVFGEIINLDSAQVGKATFPGTCALCNIKFPRCAPIASYTKTPGDSVSFASHLYCWIAKRLEEKTSDDGPFEEALKTLCNNVIHNAERVTAAVHFWRDLAQTYTATQAGGCTGEDSSAEVTEHYWACDHSHAPWNMYDISIPFGDQ